MPIFSAENNQKINSFQNIILRTQPFSYTFLIRNFWEKAFVEKLM